MNKKLFAVVNGPNLNLLGQREPNYYGSTTWSQIQGELEQSFGDKVELSFFQSNYEGALIDYLQNLQNSQKASALVINPGALTHTSIALRDALIALNISSIEVHLSNIYKREVFRHKSYFSDVCLGVISGLGPQVYTLAIQALLAMNNS